MPVIDFEDCDQYDAAIEFLVRRGITFHTRPPQQLIVGPVDYKSLEDAKIIPGSGAKTIGSRGKKTRSSPKPKSGRTS